MTSEAESFVMKKKEIDGTRKYKKSIRKNFFNVIYSSPEHTSVHFIAF